MGMPLAQAVNREQPAFVEMAASRGGDMMFLDREEKGSDAYSNPRKMEFLDIHNVQYPVSTPEQAARLQRLLAQEGDIDRCRDRSYDVKGFNFCPLIVVANNGVAENIQYILD